MGFKYELRLADGDDAGTFETSASENWQVGDTLIADGNRRYRVTAVLAPERLAEFVDGWRTACSRSSRSKGRIGPRAYQEMSQEARSARRWVQVAAVRPAECLGRSSGPRSSPSPASGLSRIETHPFTCRVMKSRSMTPPAIRATPPRMFPTEIHFVQPLRSAPT